MSVEDRLEDFEAVKGVIAGICEAVRKGTGMPEIIPVCNDLTLTDGLSMICEYINGLRRVLP